ncbi:NAD(P)H-dependent glycerol-3-phosphate dehydrogenase [Mangrovicoccus algicola]|uniref:Glycerol-3-phosphate dehydrogenase [NAD(P)+] n=1 Tax=Mangrovicoccus algicola TaxID=2771008 RepID=A0A8J7CZT9_9RHOB|nr:NAD(P)H-dependent glycerol-3-phosphate dehydrogenase [Mangrovicoccus algicola]MBE3638428.1 NAD(P)-dependent glycerol-3-phosphate dehydrogenase [Mangrovicoccus algicola]
MQHELPDAQDRRSSIRPYSRVAILGGGSWGTAIAAIARRAGREVTIWARDPDVARGINDSARNEKYLPGIPLPEGIAAYTDLAGAVRDAEAIFLVTPSHSIRDMARQLNPLLHRLTPIVVCAKGIEADTGLLMSSVVEEELPGHAVGALSGPTFAAEAARGDYTAATLAFDFRTIDRIHPEHSPAARLAVSLGCESFRPYLSDDLAGLETAGAMKNVVAIACGMMTGVGFAENTRAALIARGLAEIQLVTLALGGRTDTVLGMGGVGDLTLTCNSRTSRNMSLGLQLGEGKARAACFDGKPVVVEGERNARSVHDLARRLNLTLPVCDTVYRILHEGADLRESFAALWSRPLEAEPAAMSVEIPHPVSLEA